MPCGGPVGPVGLGSAVQVVAVMDASLPFRAL